MAVFISEEEENCGMWLESLMIYDPIIVPKCSHYMQSFNIYSAVCLVSSQHYSLVTHLIDHIPSLRLDIKQVAWKSKATIINQNQHTLAKK